MRTGQPKTHEAEGLGPALFKARSGAGGERYALFGSATAAVRPIQQTAEDPAVGSAERIIATPGL